MKISGFTFAKNAQKLYFPIKQSIESILPIVDEFVIALDKGDADDKTEELLKSIDSDKIKIVYVKWEPDKYPWNTIYAQQTDVAKEACSGDWLFYIQSDEAMHEKWLPVVKNACKKYLDNKKVEGFLFKYKHFWGDYRHYHRSHVWYPKEIRIVRNDSKIHSWKDAQSFRKFETFDHSFEAYHQKGGKKLNVIQLPAEIFHYGYVRPPHMMRKKAKSNEETFFGKFRPEMVNRGDDTFYYGPLNLLTEFKGEHPAVMKEWIDDFHWKDQLQYSGKRLNHKHDRLKYRVISWFENHIFKTRLWGFKNYKIVGKVK